MYAYRVKKFIGSYIAVLDGLDLLVFTGGVGENDFNMRKLICSDMENLGIIFDDKTNQDARGKDITISKPKSKVKVMCITTDEECVIANDTRYIVEHQTI
jgi:acetate kinase